MFNALGMKMPPVFSSCVLAALRHHVCFHGKTSFICMKPPSCATSSPRGTGHIVIERGRLQVIHRYRNPGDAVVAGAEVEPEPPRTSNVLSHGDDFPKRIETKSELVTLV